MDFFDHQERARRNTVLLTIYFVLAIIMIIACVYFAVLGILVFTTDGTEQPIPFYGWHPELLGSVVVVVGIIVATGSLFKIWMLGGHGETVAIALGGVKVPANTTALDERILLNVVEEMALASGTPVPPVYILENESGINAFAAGTSPQNAVIGITRGAITTLRRDELQGVIAHEFSHILNGDMKLNLRLMGLLHGILLIALIGYLFIRYLSFASMRGSSRSDDNKGAAGVMAALFLLGSALIVIGYVGVFFANMIKSAVSRQREFLADASAVQFTRNPNGISDALKRIGGWKQHARLTNARASESSHMFFGEGVASFLFATHPPLPVRIKRIEPNFQGIFPTTAPVTHSVSELIDPNSLAMARASFAGGAAAGGAAVGGTTAGRAAIASGATTSVHQAALAGAVQHERQPEKAVSHIGEPRPEHLVHAHNLVDELAPLLAEDIRDPLGAVAIIYALLLAPKSDPVREKQMETIQIQADPRVTQELIRVLEQVGRLDDEQRLPLACLALPALHQMSPNQVKIFRKTVLALIEADRIWTVFEFAIQRFITKRLVNRLVDNTPSKIDSKSELPLANAFQVVLSALAYVGSNADDPANSFAIGLNQSKIAYKSATILPREQCTLKSLDGALNVLEKANGSKKREMLEAFSACIAADGKVELSELELLRVIADALGCPMPPILQETLASHDTRS
ncbi:MAG: M48 family metallopeptidase [Planctomycetota bacterium]|nr:M48 family metallopeptidase [Planctomycetota bacterium]